MKSHRSRRARRRTSGEPPTSGPLTANYKTFEGELDINVFATSETGELLQALVSSPPWPPQPFYYDLGTTDLGGGLGGLLAAVQGGTPINFFGVTEGGHLLWQYWNLSNWSGWQDLGAPDSSLGELASALGATNPTETGAWAFAVTDSAELVLYDLDTSEWQDLGTCQIAGGLGFSIAATCPQEGMAFVVGAAINGDVVVRPYGNGQWLGEWTDLAPPSNLKIETVSAASGPNALDLVAVDENGSVWYTNSADGVSFTTWEPIGGTKVLPGLTVGAIAPVPGYDHQLDVFALSEEGDFLWCWLTALQGWSQFANYGVWQRTSDEARPSRNRTRTAK
jgi:hypothetical protein